MNKYQEALDFLFDKAAKEYEIDEESCEVNILDCTSHDKYLKPCLKLQELVDKATPKKIEIWNGQYSCPNCKTLFFPNTTSIGLPKNFCDKCGQPLDWSDNNTEPDDVDEQSVKGSLRELEFQIKNAINYGHSDIYLEVESAKRILYFIKKNIGEE
ncbi:hypothetical protein [[Eubacterium] hominis]|uniref:hypothetical protein n=1 Tax=[Eubacterium] hominis TaxID=2764325 RepID=UPI0022E2868A